MNSNLKNWKTAYHGEKLGQRNFGIKIEVAIDRAFTHADNRVLDKAAEEIEQALMRESMRQDPEEQEKRKQERDKLLECFGEDKNIYVEELPNGYCSSWCCVMRPWYKVTTRRGVITIGWRKRVINLSWEPTFCSASADEIFPNEDVTTFERTIHAWGYDKAREYIARLMTY